MNAGQLKKLLRKVPNDMKVFFAPTEKFEGIFFSPCMGESGVHELGLDEDTENGESEMSFVLVTHGFFDIDENEPDPQLN